MFLDVYPKVFKLQRRTVPHFKAKVIIYNSFYSHEAPRWKLGLLHTKKSVRIICIHPLPSWPWFHMWNVYSSCHCFDSSFNSYVFTQVAIVLSLVSTVICWAKLPAILLKFHMQYVDSSFIRQMLTQVS